MTPDKGEPKAYESLPKGEALIGYVIVVTDLLAVSDEEKAQYVGQQAVVERFFDTGEDQSESDCGAYFCRFNDGNALYVRRDRMRPV